MGEKPQNSFNQSLIINQSSINHQSSHNKSWGQWETPLEPPSTPLAGQTTKFYYCSPLFFFNQSLINPLRPGSPISFILIDTMGEKSSLPRSSSTRGSKVLLVNYLGAGTTQDPVGAGTTQKVGAGTTQELGAGTTQKFLGAGTT